jgi:hypothetical protein
MSEPQPMCSVLMISRATASTTSASHSLLCSEEIGQSPTRSVNTIQAADSKLLFNNCKQFFVACGIRVKRSRDDKVPGAHAPKSREPIQFERVNVRSGDVHQRQLSEIRIGVRA